MPLTIDVIVRPEASWDAVDRVLEREGGRHAPHHGIISRYVFPEGTDLNAVLARLKPIKEVDAAAPGADFHLERTKPPTIVQ